MGSVLEGECEDFLGSFAAWPEGDGDLVEDFLFVELWLQASSIISLTFSP